MIRISFFFVVLETVSSTHIADGNVNRVTDGVCRSNSSTVLVVEEQWSSLVRVRREEERFPCLT